MSASLFANANGSVWVLVIAVFGLLSWVLAWYLRRRQLAKEIVNPILDRFRRRFDPYTIRELDIQEIIEGNDNTDEVLVIVNHLNYELDESLEYHKVMAKNINRSVPYRYFLPTSMKADWNRVKQNLREKGPVSNANLQQFLRACFTDERLTSVAIYGLAIYRGKAPYNYRNRKQKIVAVQYSKDYWRSFLVETSNASDDGAKAVSQVIGLFEKYKNRFKCDHA